MNKKYFAAMFVALLATACTGNKANNADSTAVAGNDSTTVAAPDLKGEWDIENIVFSDSDYVKPSEAVADARQYINFEDSTYSIHTNCNTIQGSYVMTGDSIKIEPGLMTEMACDNMATEDALRRILPSISTIEVQNDSVIRLNGANPAECIILKKAVKK